MNEIMVKIDTPEKREQIDRMTKPENLKSIAQEARDHYGFYALYFCPIHKDIMYSTIAFADTISLNVIEVNLQKFIFLMCKSYEEIRLNEEDFLPYEEDFLPFCIKKMKNKK